MTTLVRALFRGERIAVKEGLVRGIAIFIAVGYVGLLLILPLIGVLVQAFSQGVGTYLEAITDTYTFEALKLSLLIVAIAVPFNTAFGFAAAWLVAKFDFRGKGLLTAVIDLPLAVSPVISGMVFVLLFGAQGWFGPALAESDIKIIFAVPGIVLATTFVTFPFVARELIPFMEEQGSEGEEAAISLGASGWQTIWRVTIPSVKWGLLYGVVLCTARSLGEFGAVSVVSGHIRGVTNTLPLHIEVLYNEYRSAEAFAVASLLVVVALITLVAKRVIEARSVRARNSRKIG